MNLTNPLTGETLNAFDPNQPRDERGRWTLEGALEGLREKFAEAAQKVYDDWKQDEEGVDEEYGTGGICDKISCAIGDIAVGSITDLEAFDGGQAGDDHAFNIFKLGDKAYAVDIPPNVYETGGGYSWKKIEGVTISPDDVQIYEVDASEFSEDNDY